MNFLNYFWGYSLLQSINGCLNANTSVPCLFGSYSTHEGLTKRANKTCWGHKPQFFKAHNLKWQILVILKWGGDVDEKSAWVLVLCFFFPEVIAFWLVTYPQSCKINKTELSVTAYFVSVSVTAKCTDMFTGSPLCCTWNVYLVWQAPEIKTQQICFWLSSLLVSAFVTHLCPGLRSSSSYPHSTRHLHPARSSNGNLFPLENLPVPFRPSGLSYAQCIPVSLQLYRKQP